MFTGLGTIIDHRNTRLSQTNTSRPSQGMGLLGFQVYMLTQDNFQMAGLHWSRFKRHPLNWDNSKIEIFKIYRFWHTDKLHRGNFPCWVKIWPCFWARPTSSLWFWLFLSKIEKKRKTSGSYSQSNTPLVWTLKVSERHWKKMLNARCFYPV